MLKKIKNLPVIIAEVGVNFDGSKKIINRMIKKISQTGADYIKFQLYNTDEMCIKNAPSADYQKKIKISQYKMLKKFEINHDKLNFIIKKSKEYKIKPIFSVFDLKSLSILKKIKVQIIKIPSGEIDNYPLLKEISKLNVKVIISSGMSSIPEIKNALKILTNYKLKKKNIFLLHCNSEYPSELKNLNLIKIKKFKKMFNCEIGYSDHSEGDLASIIAVTFGAKIIEKHVTLSKKRVGPDHSSSLEIKYLKTFVKQLKNINISIGSFKKERSAGENKNKKIVRKSLVANTYIKKGTKFSKLNLAFKRPAYGLSPKYYQNIIGKKAKKSFKKDDFIALK